MNIYMSKMLYPEW